MKNKINTAALNPGIRDSEKEISNMQPEESTLDLPDVKDIPGQEHIPPPKMNAMADTTISSAAEEGKLMPDTEEDEWNNDSNVSQEEKQLLENSATSRVSSGDQEWDDVALDNTDHEGESLNEANDFSGSDLDIPGAEDDDENEKLGEEDEENNSYSLGGDNNN